MVSDPERIGLPTIGVDAPVIDLGLQADGSLEVPADFGDVGWWSGGGQPGEVEPAVLAGHVDSKDGPAVFYRLEELKAGDPVTVTGADGAAVTYRVTRSERVPKDQFPSDAVYDTTDVPEVRLVTCDGDFNRATRHYEENLVVYGRLLTE